jgi:light-regulated signal transduction histidine kinase (bacteriophytochrome)
MICAFTPVRLDAARTPCHPDPPGSERERELEAYSHAVAHDLRAPLRVLDGYLGLLEEELLGGSLDAARSHLQRGRASIRHMQAMIGRLLQLPHLHQVQVPRERLDLGALASELLAELRAAEPSRSVHLQLVPPLALEADPVLLRILMQNLLANAWKYTNRRQVARITVGSCRRDGRRTFFVEDNGVGFPPSASDRLFRPFQRLHPASEFDGTGIGLVTARRVVDCHNGRIWAEGRPGCGATFFFTLQESPATGSVNPAPTSPSPQPRETFK